MARKCRHCSSTECTWRRQKFPKHTQVEQRCPFPEPVDFRFGQEIANRLKKRIPRWRDAEPHLRWACEAYVRNRGLHPERAQTQRKQNLRWQKHYESIARHAEDILRLAREPDFSLLSDVLRDGGYDHSKIVASLEGLCQASKGIAAVLGQQRRRGPRPDPWRDVFHMTVAVIVQRYGVRLTKSDDSDYRRIVEFLYEAMNLESDRPTFRTLKRSLDSVASASWTWCDYEIGQVRFDQSIRLREQGDAVGRAAQKSERSN